VTSTEYIDGDRQGRVSVSVGEKSHDYDHTLTGTYLFTVAAFFLCALFISSPEWMDKCACVHAPHRRREGPTG
jgi:hypothetical protein